MRGGGLDDEALFCHYVMERAWSHLLALLSSGKALLEQCWKLGAAEQTLYLCRIQLQDMRGAKPKSKRGERRPREPCSVRTSSAI